MMADRAPLLAQLDVSRETLDRLDRFAELLRKWNPRINLIAPDTLNNMWHRHFADSAQLWQIAGARAGTWADLGSGGGFPGLVIAILNAELRELDRIVLVESDRRKATFLRTVLRETSVQADVLDVRAEMADPLHAKIVSARALAPLPKLLGLVDRHLSPEGIALLPKGATYRDELKEALELWKFRCEEFPSRTDPHAVILKISELCRV